MAMDDILLSEGNDRAPAYVQSGLTLHYPHYTLTIVKGRIRVWTTQRFDICTFDKNCVTTQFRTEYIPAK